MDLVLVTDKHFNGGPRQIDFERRKAVTNTLFSTARKLQFARIAEPSWQAITKAKVPIIKFVDCQTGIKVDLSFENLSGVDAQDSFREWKAHLPDLLPMVALVKQFLLMRGLNDVHTGGLGGFSTICLVYHHLYQELPKDSGEKPKSLGELFLGFLDFYGNQFDLATQRLEMAPTPKVVPKQAMGIDGRPEKPDGLSIQDPHNAENNISGGSQKAKHIFRAFAEAHKVLHDRLSALDLSGTSILESILGGNYESYRQHRERVRRTS
jgi:non-canonical poly(A) RNA polymerase PAPD5/7